MKLTIRQSLQVKVKQNLKIKNLDNLQNNII